MTKLQVGDPAPAFTLPDADRHPVSLSDFSGRKVVVYFYPAAMTPGCTTQAVDFTADSQAFADAGYDVIGISPDDTAKLERFRDQVHISFPLLADPTKDVMDAYGAYGTKMLYGRQVEGVIRSTFVVDVDADGHGTISEALYNVRATGHVAKLRRGLGI